MKLGAFSISLNVQDLAASRAFYQKLGFAVVGGAEEDHYLILRNDAALVGLFHGMFERNILTFNPGLSQDGEPSETDDVRDIQAKLRESGLELDAETDPDGSGAGHLIVSDPDGNPILIDQFS